MNFKTATLGGLFLNKFVKIVFIFLIQYDIIIEIEGVIEMWQEFLNLFDGYGLIAMIIMLFGLFLCMIEVIVPGFGVFGILGTIFTFGGMLIKIILGITILQFVSMVLLALAVAIVSVVLVVVLGKTGVIGKSSIVQEKTAIPKDYDSLTKEQKKLIGKVGFAVTVFKTSGKFKFNDKIYDAVSTGEYIEKDSKVKVVEIRNNTIFVKKV